MVFPQPTVLPAAVQPLSPRCGARGPERNPSGTAEHQRSRTDSQRGGAAFQPGRLLNRPQTLLPRHTHVAITSKGLLDLAYPERHMPCRPFVRSLLIFAAALTAVPCHAEQIRIRYWLQDSGPQTVLKPADPGHPTGVRISRFGLRREPYYCLPKANCLKAFSHRYTGQIIVVPLYLPPGTPRIAHTWSGISYQYTGFSVNVVFLRDGSVEVVYDDGPF